MANNMRGDLWKHASKTAARNEACNEFSNASKTAMISAMRARLQWSQLPCRLLRLLSWHLGTHNQSWATTTCEIFDVPTQSLHANQVSNRGKLTNTISGASFIAAADVHLNVPPADGVVKQCTCAIIAMLYPHHHAYMYVYVWPTTLIPAQPAAHALTAG